jgi:hypothetical protein
VDLVARALLLLAGAADWANETHHIENARRDTVADFVTMAESTHACDFGAFLKRLEEAVGEPEMEGALAETLENFGLYRGLSPQARARRMEIVSARTQMLLAQLGLIWPSLAVPSQKEMLQQAARLFSPPPSAKTNAA